MKLSRLFAASRECRRERLTPPPCEADTAEKMRTWLNKTAVGCEEQAVWKEALLSLARRQDHAQAHFRKP